MRWIPSHLLSFAFALLPMTAYAGTITLYTEANASIPNGGFDQDQMSGTLSTATDLQLTSSALGVYNDQNMSSSLTTEAYAFIQALGGSLSMGVDAYSSALATFTGGPVGATTNTGGASAAVSVDDGLTVFGGPTSGYLALTFSIDGNLITTVSGPSTGANTATAGGTFFVNTNTDPDYFVSGNAHSQSTSIAGGSLSASDSFQFPSSWSVLLPYTNSFANMLLFLGTSAGTGTNCGNYSLVSGSTCLEFANGALGNTVILQYIQVLDGQQQLVSGAYVVGASGIQYNNMLVAPPAPVPEPATLLLLGTGLGIAGVRRRLRKRG